MGVGWVGAGGLQALETLKSSFGKGLCFPKG